MQIQESGRNVTLTIAEGAVYPEDSATATQQATVITATATEIEFSLGPNQAPSLLAQQAQAAQAQQAQVGQGAQSAPASDAFKAAPPAAAVTLTPSDGSDPTYKLDPLSFVVFVAGLIAPPAA